MTRVELLRRAMLVLVPTADYVQRDEEIEWNDQTQVMPSAEVIEAEIQRQAGLIYRENRAAEYPPIGDQLDALFHAGVFPAEMAAQIQAVKDKYPKV